MTEQNQTSTVASTPVAQHHSQSHAPSSAPRLLDAVAPGLDTLAHPIDLIARPTPVTVVSALAEKWRLADFRVKREDLTHPWYGGCKVRTLEYILGHARAQGAKGIVTMGPHGSHQAVSLAIFGRLHGFQTRVVLAPRLATPEIDHNGRMLPLYGMETLRCGSFVAVPLALIRALLRPLGGGRPYWLPPGSKSPVGILGIVESALELAQAVKSGELPMPDDVLVPTGTCATAAGLLLGFAIAGLKTRVVAVRIVPKIVTGPRKLRRLAENTLALLRRHGFNGLVNWGEMLWVDDHAGPGYGRDNAWSEQAGNDVAETGCFPTEPTYTSKALGLLASGALAGRRVLYWNTYSAVEPRPDLFA